MHAKCLSWLRISGRQQEHSDSAQFLREANNFWMWWTGHRDMIMFFTWHTFKLKLACKKIAKTFGSMTKPQGIRMVRHQWTEAQQNLPLSISNRAKIEGRRLGRSWAGACELSHLWSTKNDRPIFKAKLIFVWIKNDREMLWKKCVVFIFSAFWGNWHMVMMLL